MQLERLANTRLDGDALARLLVGRPTSGPGVLRVCGSRGWVEVVATHDVVDHVEVVDELRGEGLRIAGLDVWLCRPDRSDVRLAPYAGTEPHPLPGRLPEDANQRAQLVLIDAPTGDLLLDVTVDGGRVRVDAQDGGWEQRSVDVPAIVTTYLRMIEWQSGEREVSALPIAVQGRWLDLLAVAGLLGLGPFAQWWTDAAPSLGTRNVMGAFTTIN